MNETTINTFNQIIEPEPILYSFNTLGWYIVWGVLAFVLVLFCIRQLYVYKKNAYRRQALNKITTLVNTADETLAYQINFLLKAMAIKLFGRTKVAALFGKQWFQFLNATVPPKLRIQTDFDSFNHAVYNTDNPLTEPEKEQIIAFAQNWIKYHKVKNV